MQDVTATTENYGPKPMPRDELIDEPVYNDEVTKTEIATLNEVVSDDDFDGWEIVNGPAW